MAKLKNLKREHFDDAREKRVRRAAELWNRAYLMDMVLAVERQLYKEHRKRVQSREGVAEREEEAAQQKVNNFYKKYSGNTGPDIKKGDMQYHVLQS